MLCSYDSVCMVFRVLAHLWEVKHCLKVLLVRSQTWKWCLYGVLEEERCVTDLMSKIVLFL